MPEPMSGCWLWEAGCCKDGYAKFHLDGESIRGHRAAWLIYRGSIPDGIQVLHRCDNPPCVNPDHLFLGTHIDNARDKAAKGRAPGMRGESNPLSRITRAEAQSIATDNVRSIQEMAAQHGVSAAAISKIRSGKLWSGQIELSPDRGKRLRMRGAKNPNARITAKIAEAIRSDGRPSREAAKAFGVSKATITSIRSGRTWK